MKILSIFVLLSLAAVSAAKPRDWKTAIVAEITSADSEKDIPRTRFVHRPGCQGGLGCMESVPTEHLIIQNSTLLIRFETPEISYLVRQIIRREGHPLNVTLNGQTKISIEGHDLHVLDDEGKDVKLPIVQKIAKLER
jgi:hypothetical protein